MQITPKGISPSTFPKPFMNITLNLPQRTLRSVKFRILWRIILLTTLKLGSLGFTVWWLAHHASTRLVVVSIPRLGSHFVWFSHCVFPPCFPAVFSHSVFPLGFPTGFSHTCKVELPKGPTVPWVRLGHSTGYGS